MSEENFLPGIYNYCDRWCERCALTARCRVYATERAALAENPAIADPEKEDYWAYIADNFAEAMQMLHQAATEMGLDLEELPDTDQDRAAERRRIGALDFVFAAHTYATEGRAWLDRHRGPVLKAALHNVELDLPDALDRAERTEDALTVASWYLFQIEVKLRRAQHGLEHPFVGSEPGVDVLEPVNAAAKIALIGIERSLGAWHFLFQLLPEHQDALIGLMATLQRTRTLTIQHFPGALDFLRPGFDD